MNRIALLMALSLLSAGCAADVARMKTETTIERYRPYVGGPIDNFTVYNFNGWELAGHNQVVIWTGVNEAYLLTVWDTCPNLDFAQGIGISSTNHAISRSETLRVGRDSCPIQSIRPIDIRRYKEDRAAAGEQK